MSNPIRRYMQRVLPPSRDMFRRANKRQAEAVERFASDTAGEVRQCASEVDALRSQTIERLERLDETIAQLASRISDLHTTQEQGVASVQSSAADVMRAVKEQRPILDELLWADVFRDSASSTGWLLDRSFSPGRWAVGYPYLYVLHRVLNEVRPKSILELGLGQSSRMIAQYAQTDESIDYTVVEHDDEWIRFFSNNYKLPKGAKVAQLELEYVPFRDAESVRVYADLATTVEGRRFGLVSIDGPLGGDMDHYARIDVLRLLPDCLESSFVIVVDDCERPSDARTFREMQATLSQSGVEAKACVYSGAKSVGLICSADLAFLCSM